ncbi:MAG TPA: ubiquinol-cytochrome c reductase iron-sulfur subunit [Gammaproteobacteria bacterium]|nr:ubiquinol-cytochrome c reductase iron-sulfur subunit [Gammaproteobacteria bacterium]
MSDKQPSEGADDTDSGDLPSRFHRRRFLNWTAAVVGSVGLGYASVPFFRAMSPSASAKAKGAPIEVDTSKLQEGQLVTAYWRSRPIWVLRRTQRELGTLTQVEDQLKDPDCKADQEPPALQKADFWQNSTRAIRPELLVLVGICTHLGCIPKYKPEPGNPRLGGDDWLGGFFCPCHGSRYDLSGRVMNGSPAPLNLPVPPYYFADDHVIRVGELPGGEKTSWRPSVW